MLLGLQPKAAKLFQLGGQTMTQRILRPQFFKQSFCFSECFFGDLWATEQLPPTARDLLIG